MGNGYTILAAEGVHVVTGRCIHTSSFRVVFGDIQILLFSFTLCYCNTPSLQLEGFLCSFDRLH